MVAERVPEFTKPPPPRAATSHAESTVPTIRTTLPDEELPNASLIKERKVSERNAHVRRRNGTGNVPNNVPVGDGGSLQSNAPGATTKSRDFSIAPRQFYLRKSASAISLSNHGPIAGGIHKKRKAQKSGNIAVFMERANELLREGPSAVVKVPSRTVEQNTETSSGQQMDLDMGGQATTQTVRKRPNRGGLGKSQPRHGGAIPTSSTGRDSKTQDTSAAQQERELRLAKQLQEFALEQAPLVPTAPAVASKAQSKPPIKYQPKVPAQRPRDLYGKGSDNVRGEDFPTVDDVEMDDDDQYVYDTYIRHENGAQSPGNHDMTDGKTGLIVIRNEDEELWNAYAEDEDTDKEWDTDDEDENGKQYQSI